MQQSPSEQQDALESSSMLKPISMSHELGAAAGGADP
jgi:hypothetical protein